MIERAALTVFFFCMPFCAGCFLYMIWMGEEQGELFFKAMATSFVIGLASFLVWFVVRMYKNVAE